MSKTWQFSKVGLLFTVKYVFNCAECTVSEPRRDATGRHSFPLKHKTVSRVRFDLVLNGMHNLNLMHWFPFPEGEDRKSQVSLSKATKVTLIIR